MNLTDLIHELDRRADAEQKRSDDQLEEIKRTDAAKSAPWPVVFHEQAHGQAIAYRNAAQLLRDALGFPGRI